MKKKLFFIKLLGVFSFTAALCVVAFGPLHIQDTSWFPKTLKSQFAGEKAEVLAESTKKKGFLGEISFNIPAIFQDKVRINADTYIDGLATVSGQFTAPNVIYGLVAGPNITISQGQRPTISASFSAVTTLQGLNGNLELAAGDDITIDGLTISNKSTLATVVARGGCDECVTDEDIADNITIGPDGNISGDAINSGVVKVSYGGTGATSFTTNGVLYGNGSGPIQVTAAPSAAQILLGNASGIPTFADMTGDIAIDASGNTTIQPDSVALGTDTTGDYQAGTTAGNGISVAGTQGEGWSPTLSLGTLTSDWTQTGAFDIALANSASELKIMDAGGSAYGIIDVGTLGSGDRTYVFPDFSGSSAFVCLSIGNCSGSGGTITGGGTTNFLARWTTGSTLGDSAFYDDGTRVGLGTAAPVAKLQVQGGIAGKALVILNETGNQNILTASASGVTKFTVDRNGNMGIGGSDVASGNYITAPNFVVNTSGTITSGSWNGSIIAPTYGGTGLNTSASTGVPTISSGTWTVNSQLPLSFGGTGANLTAVAGGIVYSGGSSMAISSAGTSGQCLTSGGAGAPTWVDCATGTISTYWNQINGTLQPHNATVDLLIGGTSTASAKFAVLNVNSGTPTASVSAGANGAAFLTATGGLQTTARQSLTLGGGNTGNIVLSGFGTGIVHSNSAGVLSSSALNLATDVTGTLGVTNGGTGLSSYSTGDLIYASAPNTLSNLPIGTSGQILGVSGGVPAWISTSSLNFWQRANGALAPINITDDLLLGSTASGSAKIGLVNIAGGTPTASISANSGNNATYVTGAGNLGTTNSQTLALGGATTGDVTISGRNGANNSIVFTGYSTGLIHADANGRLTSSAVNLSGTDVTGTLGVANGGTGVSSLTTNGVLYGGSTVGATAAGTNGQILVGVTGSAPTFATMGGDATINNSGTLTLANSGVSAATYGSASQVPVFTVDAKGRITSVTNTAIAIAASQITSGQLSSARGGTGADLSSAAQGSVPYFSATGVMSALAPSTAGYVLTTNDTGANPTWSDPTTLGYWNRVNGALSPKQASVTDLLLGSNATASAKFAFINVTAGTPTASISANSGNNAVYLTGDGTLATTNKQSLTLGNSSTGNIILNGGLVGIGTTTPAAPLSVAGNGTSAVQITQAGGNDALAFINSSSSNKAWSIYQNGNDLRLWEYASTIANGSGNTRLTLQAGGNLGLGTTTPLATLDVRGNSASTPIASFSGATNLAGMIVDNGGNGDIFTASKSGKTKFTILNNGTISFAGAGNVLNTITTSATSSRAYNFPDASGDVCLTSGNCAGVGGGITGSGTSGQIAFFNGSGTITSETSGFAWDATNNKLGIGNDTPAGKLDVSGAATGKALAILNETGDQNILTGSASGTMAFAFDRTGNLTLSSTTATSDSFIFTPHSGGSGSFAQTVTSEDLTANRTITFPDATGTVCLTTGNCAGVGGNGDITSVGSMASGDAFANSSADDQWLGLGASAGRIEFDDQTVDEINLLSAKLGLGTSTPLSLFHASGATTGKALGIFDETGDQAILTGSASGTTRFTFDRSGNLNIVGGAYQIGGASVLSSTTLGSSVVNSSLTSVGALNSGSITSGFGSIDIGGDNLTAGGTITFSGLTTNGGLLYTNGSGTVAQTTAGTSGQVLISNGGGAPSWTDAANLGINYWQRANGRVAPLNITDDLLLGGTATNTAKFAFINNAAGTPTASVSANSGNIATYLTGDGTLATTNRNTLTIGNSSTYNTTGNILLNPNGTGNVGIGTSTPTSLLTVGGTVGATALTIGSGQALTRSSNNLVLNATSLSNAGIVFMTAPSIERARFEGTTGNFAYGTSTPLASFDIRANSATLAVASVSGSTNMAALITDNTGNGDIFTASKSGASKFTVLNSGNVQIHNLTTNGGLLYTNGSGVVAQTTAGTAGQLLISNGGGAPTWTDAGAAGINYWQRNLGSLAPLNVTDDLLLGSTATTSAKIGLFNIGSGTPTASISANSGNNATFVTGAGNLGTTNAQTLALGGSSTGDITLSGRNGANNAIVFTGYSTGLIHADANGRLTSSAVNLAGADVTGILGVTNGGTGVSSLTSNGVLYGGATVGVTAAGTTGTVLKGNTGGAPTFGAVDLATDTTGILPTSKGGSYWTASNGGLYPGNSTYDLFVGGTSTNSAKFAVVNVNSGTPTASVSAGVNGATFITADGNIQTTSKQTLTLGGGNTGNIALSGFGSGILHSNASGVLSSSALNLATEVTGTLGATNGGTGQNTVATGDLLYGSGTNTWSKLAIGSPGQILSVSGGLPAWIATSSINFWQRANGVLAPLNITDDLLLGSTATTSAKIGLFNIAGGTPTASISANSGDNATYLTGDGTLATTNKQTLTLGNSSTGNVILNGGNVGIGTTTPGAALDVNGNLLVGAGGSIDTRAAGTLALGGTNATTITLGRSGQGITLPGFATNNNSVLTTGASGVVTDITTTTSGLCLMSNSAPGTPSWQTCPGGGSAQYWTQANGSLYPLNSTVDLLVGGQASNSAKFAVLNMNTGTPTASVSAGVNGAAFLTATGGLQTTAKQSLTLGGGNTGNIVLSGFGSGILHSNALGVLSSSAIDLASEVSGTLGIFNGGTGATAIGGAGSIAYSNGSSYAFTGVGSSGQVLTSQGSGSPIWTDQSNIGYWDRANGAVYPKQASVTDLLLGSNATTSAKFAFKNVTAGTPTASISANSGNNALYMTGDGTLATTNRGNLTLGNSSAYDTTGNILLNPNGTGLVGIGTTTPGTYGVTSTKFDIVDNDFARMSFIATDPATDVLGVIDARGDGGTGGADRMQIGTFSDHAVTFFTNSLRRMEITSVGNIRLGGDPNSSTNTTLSSIDMRANSGTIAIASVSGQTAHAGMVVDNSGVGDIFTASSSGLSRFTVKQNGNVGIGTTLPTAKLDVNGTASISGALKLYGTPTIQSTANQTLTIGGDTTGNIAINPRNGAGTVTIDGGLVLSNTSGEGISGAGLTSDCRDTSSGTSPLHSTEKKLQYNATTKQFECANDGTAQIAVKNTTETRNNNTMTNDSELYFDVGANEIWTFDATIAVTSGTTPDYKQTWSVPSGSTCFYTEAVTYENSGATTWGDTCTDTDIWNWGVNGELVIFKISGTIFTGGTSGTVQHRWAQNTTSVTDTSVLGYDSMIKAYKVSGADVAESYYTKDQSVEPGDIVMADGSLGAGVQKSGRAYDSRTLGIISTQPGVILGDNTRPEGKRVYMALNGRVPVKVNGENGPIKAGDYITTSSTPGIAMKATKAGQMIGKALQDYDPSDPHASGKLMVFTNLSWADPSLTLTEDGNFHSDNMAIGAEPETEKEKADFMKQLKDITASVSGMMTKQQQHSDKIQLLEERMDREASESASLSAMTTFAPSPFTASTASELNLSDNDFKNVTISDTLNVLGKSTLSNVGITGKLTAGLLTVNGLDDSEATAAATLNTSAGPLKLQSTGLNGIDFFNGKVVFKPDGSITTKQAVTAKKFNVDTADILSASLGEGTMPAGKTSVTIKTTAVTDKSKIFLTPKTKTSLPLSVTDQDAGKSFTVEIETELLKDLKFNWWIVN